MPQSPLSHVGSRFPFDTCPTSTIVSRFMPSLFQVHVVKRLGLRLCLQGPMSCTKICRKQCMYDKVKFFKFPTNKFFSTGREKRFHAIPERRLRQGSNEMLDRSNETPTKIVVTQGSNDMLDGPMTCWTGQMT
ncbi:hypothetical protein TNCV_1978591 [Trichonephila clavipes]|nr:hypothetical protein TNCV_1978591 [Trichonephila clavipes]